jgi:hypothetical protein
MLSKARVVVVCFLALAGCNTTLESDAALLQSSLTVLETAAKQYAEMPLCDGSNAPLCSDRVVLMEIQRADKIAYDSVVAFRTAVGESREPARVAAVTAIGTLRTLVINLPRRN